MAFAGRLYWVFSQIGSIEKRGRQMRRAPIKSECFGYREPFGTLISLLAARHLHPTGWAV